MSRVIAVIGFVGLVVSSSGCNWWGQHGSVVAADALATVECVVKGAIAKQTVEQISLSCGVATAEEVVSILAATSTPVVSSTVLTGVMAAHPAMKVVVKK